MTFNFSGIPFESSSVTLTEGLSPRQLNRFPQRLLTLSPQAATFNRRGFTADNPQKQTYLETVGQTFIFGYNIAITSSSFSELFNILDAVPLLLRGFAYEGAAMALSVLDELTPWKSDRFKQFLATEGKKHIYMAYVGKGWQLARIPLTLQIYLKKLQNSAQILPDPLLGWLAIDGYGFHRGYFTPDKYIQTKKLPQELSGYARQVFDQGLGRSLWFVKGANIAEIFQTIQEFDQIRRSDLWSGIGLACAYAGGVTEKEIQQLKELTEPYRPQLAQGAAFAAKTRLLAENLTENTEIACQILCGMTVSEAAKITDDTLIDLDKGGTIPIYEQWRQRIQSYFPI